MSRYSESRMASIFLTMVALIFVNLSLIICQSEIDDSQYIDTQQNLSFAIGDDFTLSCTVLYFKNYKLSWFKNEEKINPITDPKYSIRKEGKLHQLVISDFQVDDYGNYFCKITRSAVIEANINVDPIGYMDDFGLARQHYMDKSNAAAPTTEQTFEIFDIVKKYIEKYNEEPPHLLEPGQVGEALIGGSHTLWCKVSMPEDYTLEWSDTQNSNFSDAEIFTQGKEENKHYLTINQVTEDEISYTCRVNRKLKYQHKITVPAYEFTEGIEYEVDITSFLTDWLIKKGYEIVIEKPEPIVITPNQNGTFDIGGSHTLSCTVTGITIYKLIWYKDSFEHRVRPDTPGGKYALSGIQGSYLTIHNIHYEDQGWYFCHLPPYTGVIHFHFAALNLHWNGMHKVYPKINTTVRIPCPIFNANEQFDGIPKWSDQDMKDVDSSKMSVDEETGVLKIENFAEKDSGLYACALTMDGGLSIASPQVFVSPAVLSKPEIFKDNTFDQYVFAGGVLRLLCICISNPTATLTWKKDNKPLTNNERTTKLENGILQIAPLKNTDSGNYICEAQNSKLERDASSEPMEILVGENEIQITDPVIIYPNPKMDEHNHILNAIEGHYLEIECLIYFNPLISVTWWKRDRFEAFSAWESITTSTENIFIIGTGNLVFKKLASKDAGLYKCEINGDIIDIGYEQSSNPSTDKMDVPTTSVEYELKISTFPLDIISSTSKKEFLNGEIGRIKCTVDAMISQLVIDWNRQISWLWNGMPIQNNYKYKIEATESLSELVIQNLQTTDSGIYQCLINNSAGFSSSWSNLSIRSDSVIANPPMDLNASYISPSEVEISWSFDQDENHNRPYFFFIQIFHEGSERVLYQKLLTNTSKSKIEYQTNTNYSVVVRMFTLKSQFYIVSDNSVPLTVFVPQSFLKPDVSIGEVIIFSRNISFTFKPETDRKFYDVTGSYDIRLNETNTNLEVETSYFIKIPTMNKKSGLTWQPNDDGYFKCWFTGLAPSTRYILMISTGGDTFESLSFETLDVDSEEGPRTLARNRKPGNSQQREASNLLHIKCHD